MDLRLAEMENTKLRNQLAANVCSACGLARDLHDIESTRK
jgi:hypothetical protein